MKLNEQNSKPNIVFITVDQMRYDCLSIAGHPVVETPNLDELARTGVRFDRAYSATPTCVPARAAIFTGQSQERHGRVGYEDCVPWKYENTMPGEFAKAGYHTQCIGKMHVYPARNLMGFHNVVLHDGYLHYNRNKHSIPVREHYDEVDDYLHWLRLQVPDADLTDLGLDCNSSTIARPWHLPEKLHPTNWVVTESIDFLRRRDPDKPFFLWMSFVRPHSPLDPPQAFLDLYKDAVIPNPPVGDWAEGDDLRLDGLNPVTSKGIVPKNRLKNAMSAYYALITHIDHQIGRFMQVLDEYGEKNNTVFLVTSDHGELIGDHNLFRKALPYEGSARVPFIMNDPGNLLGLNKGKLVQEVVEMRDIMPTLLDAAGLPIPASVDGASLLKLALSSSDADAGSDRSWRTHLHGEHTYGIQSNQWLTDGKEKYIWFSQTGEEQLFLLTEDPQELHNAAHDEESRERLEYWRSVLIQELIGREEGYSDGKQLFIGCTPVTVLSHMRN